MVNKKIINEISKSNRGISIEKYINICLFDTEGYYNNVNPLGKSGDFITAPEISQLFGEIIGLYIYNIWKEKFNNNFNLIELGPGKGSLLLDILRITKGFSKFKENLNIYLIEINKTLINKQKKNILFNKLDLQKFQWNSNISNIEKKNSIIIANEFFDCFPVRHFVKRNNKWKEKVINYNEDEKKFYYQFEDIDDDKTIIKLSNYSTNDIAEISNQSEEYFESICKFISKIQGVFIIIDYGYYDFPGHFTLQAILNHKYSNLLDNPGKQDISSLVNFKSFIKIAKNYDLSVEYLNQKEFLENHGIVKRKESLKKVANEETKIEIENAFSRLLNEKNMGSDFKFLIISNK
ncbi:MAG: hypothetical protein CFH18_00528 [Alphaproteobacteria bacterium MarineAlpha5_Bin8]|nr:MAG: hypothetical protein CFH17_00879 [Alphaproteobacteria bacterium MarineAlpha5_Bin7]PPR46770.1 MAG: hypothetical protein CFH18_00528 [Alphaproteobacteria bacterium MarineAlpha5_Bin8]PPR52967.1 MAG: hypothetical protein CFH16_01265 [Alphaproteobacteria bacterium MarineAlpha5_Bin6]|tara:strand:- start:684 stop:1733 length:1050 start_codon:yes stop_codon:yes gene_type:complete